ncbi:hypothetical protein DEO23_04605 [Brachybacterium endophyticum]|uniref:DUF624 domain-containing protein n=1 Tax=Brachybacterium endophyticum TaxID=2182385 RepID=A0A2U2RKA9_9MICO|nr:hypothetical protein [Brachybacterium endophyticum]PWH06271.1 hypothetical protein DEO23_04605 [Brachybacterium endophyticum]
MTTSATGPAATAVTAPTAPSASRTIPSAGHESDRDPRLEPQGLLRFFVLPGALIAANAAALLGVLTVIGLVTALAAATRTTTRLGDSADTAFRSTISRIRRTLLRDAPTSALLVLTILAIGFDGLFLASLPASSRVLVAGVLTPPTWAMIAWLSAYVRVAAESEEVDWLAVAREAMGLCASRPLRALLAPLAVAVLSPLWLLAPLTIACGFSLPPLLTATLWGPWAPPAPQDRRDPGTPARSRPS